MDKIPFHDFLSLFDLIGVCKFSKSAISFWTQSESKRHSLYYMKVPEDSQVQITLHQRDMRFLKDKSPSEINYHHSRITLAKITQQDILFMGCTYQANKNSQISRYLEEGAYIILVEQYQKNNLRKNFFVSSYSNTKNIYLLEIFDRESTLYNKLELEIWKNCMLVQSEGLKSEIVDMNAET